ncbi:DUF397 domain-containing protein [Streptomyces sp. Z26]|uniref:DUF397 domain-containing protein n=1 Tax=Streptomyces TaxID=1883 RepID=UPI000EF13556|nr:DUF397 domain-containing protein [Streptomyces sp. Z26]RLL66271.1 DUF397 domain-containing protein [Streptomyces sp. Z26]
MNVEASVQAASGAVWFKSSHSSGEGGECVEVAAGGGGVLVRDSKNSAGPVLSVHPDGWTAFLTHAAAAR